MTVNLDLNNEVIRMLKREENLFFSSSEKCSEEILGMRVGIFSIQ